MGEAIVSESKMEATIDDVKAGAPEGEAGNKEVDLEAGIASIFASIRSAPSDAEAPRDLPEESGATYALLTELDRLWQNA
jgi:hypothetical protein